MNSNAKILIVDDDPLNVELLEELLDDYDCFVATSGEETLKMVPQCKPDLVLLDVTMPGISGYEVCKKLKENQSINRSKIIFISGRSTVSEKDKGYQSGADDYIIKPFEEEELFTKIQMCLEA